MKRLLMLLLFAVPLAAQSADLRTLIDVSTEPVQHGQVIQYTATLENLGPDTATAVEFTAASGQDICTKQLIPAFAPGERRVVDCQTRAPSSGFATSVGASVQSHETPDPNFRNNNTSVTIQIITPPDLSLWTFSDPVVDAGLPYHLHVGYGNFAHAEATNVTITVRNAGRVSEVPENCTSANNDLICVIGTLPARPLNAFPDFRSIGLNLIAPDESNHRLPLRLEIKGDQIDANPQTNVHEPSIRTFRTFFVTNTNDDGSGSLRQAMHEANASCREAGYCKIAFRIPPAGAKWQTIAPQSPLPLLVAPSITIDGAVQRRYFSNTNEDGPEVEISGAALREGNGIEFGCAASIFGLAINGFPGTAIQSSTASCAPPAEVRPGPGQAIFGNYLGTDPTGMTAIPNQRGIHLDNAGVSLISENVISGNLRSGIFIERGNAVISRNKIGLNRIPNAGLGNGASGIYLGPHADGTDVRDNYIGFNAHFGISLHPAARYNEFAGNSFQANHNLAIDFGLDGPTREVPDESDNSRPVVMPVIASARYDAASDETIIEGSSESSTGRHEVWVNLYANDERDPSGFGEGQYYLGKVKAAPDMSFRFTIMGRPPGRWIAATTTRINIIGFARTPGVQSICGCGFTSTTSEFGRAVELQ